MNNQVNQCIIRFDCFLVQQVQVNNAFERIIRLFDDIRDDILHRLDLLSSVHH